MIESLANRYNFKGYLQCDGFAGYETAFKTRSTLVACQSKNPDQIGKAITYAYTRWDNMMRYLEDGRLLLDKGGNRDVDNIVEGTTLPRMRYVPLRWAGRTISSAETMRLHRT